MGVDVESGKTFEDLLLEVAERAGVASYGNDGMSPAALPTDAHALSKLKRVVNLGYKRFLAERTDWSFALSWEPLLLDPNGEEGLRIGGDAGRYLLPRYIHSAPVSNWFFRDAAAPYLEAINCSPRVLLPAFTRDQGRSTPRYIACRRIPDQDSKSGVNNRWEALIHPRPDRRYLVEAEFRVVPYDMTELNERHVAGAAHDNTILYACLWEWFKDDRRQPERAERYAADYAHHLDRSQAIDKAAKPTRRGVMRDPGIHNIRAPRSRRPVGLVTRVGGIDIVPSHN